LWASLEHKESGEVACKNENKCESTIGKINGNIQSTVDYAKKRIKSLKRQTPSNTQNTNSKIYVVKKHLEKDYTLVGRDHIFYKAIVLKLDNETKTRIEKFKLAKYIKKKNKKEFFDIVHYCYDRDKIQPNTNKIYKINTNHNQKNLFLAAAHEDLLESIATTFYLQ